MDICTHTSVLTTHGHMYTYKCTHHKWTYVHVQMYSPHMDICTHTNILTTHGYVYTYTPPTRLTISPTYTHAPCVDAHTHMDIYTCYTHHQRGQRYHLHIHTHQDAHTHTHTCACNIEMCMCTSGSIFDAYVLTCVLACILTYASDYVYAYICAYVICLRECLRVLK